LVIYSCNTQQSSYTRRLCCFYDFDLSCINPGITIIFQSCFYEIVILIFVSDVRNLFAKMYFNDILSFIASS